MIKSTLFSTALAVLTAASANAATLRSRLPRDVARCVSHGAREARSRGSAALVGFRQTENAQVRVARHRTVAVGHGARQLAAPLLRCRHRAGRLLRHARRIRRPRDCHAAFEGRGSQDHRGRVGRQSQRRSGHRRASGRASERGVPRSRLSARARAAGARGAESRTAVAQRIWSRSRTATSTASRPTTAS